MDLPLLKSKFFSFPAISLLARVGVGGWGKAENKAKLSPAGAGSWAELGNIIMISQNQKTGVNFVVLQTNLQNNNYNLDNNN